MKAKDLAVYTFIILFAVVFYLGLQLYNTGKKLEDIETALGNGHWGVICSADDINPGTGKHDVFYFADKGDCEGKKKGIQIWVRNNEVMPFITLNTPVPTPTDIVDSVLPTATLEQQKAPKLISVIDSLGNTHEIGCSWYATHFECLSLNHKEVTLSITKNPEITFTVKAEDPGNRPVKYGFNYTGGCDWSDKNTCTTSLKDSPLGLRGFNIYIKNDDNYGTIGLDANALLYYRIME